MPVKTNQERIKEYLVGEKGYLKSDLSNGKVIMLSGRWGSGKTHFWQNEITENLKTNFKEEEKGYSYLSLYGKSSIVEIENDIFGQIYSDAIGGENIVSKTASTFTKLTKRYGGFSSLLDFSKLAESAEVDAKNYMDNTAFKRLEKGGLICFDDFERKSKDIDLNDLFGFITQLTLNFQCKVVIILNDDVFEGEEKDVFSKVKEKTISKFLKYVPSIEELFTSIFDNDERYRKLDEHKEIILKTIEESEELNARIYFQVLDNLFEWIDNKQEINDDILRCLILVNINFGLYHTIVYKKKTIYQIKDFYDNYESQSNSFNERSIEGVGKKFETFEEYYKNLLTLSFVGKDKPEEKRKVMVNFIDEHKSLYKSKFFVNELNISNGVKEKIFQKINNFIETGILIDE